MVGNADQCLNADFLEYELTFGEELASKALEQVGLNLLAGESETCEFLRGEVCGDAKHELRREAQEVGGVRHDVMVGGGEKREGVGGGKLTVGDVK